MNYTIINKQIEYTTRNRANDYCETIERARTIKCNESSDEYNNKLNRNYKIF